MFTVSCFILSIRNRWYLTTAGHVLKELQALHSNPDQRILESSLFDGWSQQGDRDFPIPFPFYEFPSFLIDRDGVDFALIALPELVSMGLAANDIQVFDEAMCKRPRSPEPHYGLLGLPHEWTQFSPQASGYLRVVPTLIPVTPCDRPAEDRSTVERFYGQITSLDTEDGNRLEEIGGMSGGPVIGFRADGDQRYPWLVGVQSSWWPQSRVIAVTPMTELADELGRMIDSINR